MKVDVLDLKGNKVREVELPANVFEAPVNVDLMHQAYTRQMANARLGTHDTKVRGEVRGGGRKPWKQKGTGRARSGADARDAAADVGGGLSFVAITTLEGQGPHSPAGENELRGGYRPCRANRHPSLAL